MQHLLTLALNSDIFDLAHHPHERMGVGYPLGIHLRELDLTNCRLRKIENIDHLVNLEKLCLRQNLITKFEGLKTLVKLQHLDLYDNHIKKIDVVTELNPLINLRILDLSFNKLHHIPCTIVKVASPDASNANSATVSTTTSVITGTLTLPNLEELYLVNNKIKAIEPQTLQNLPKLRILELGSNRIRVIENLEPVAATLKELWLGNNKIAEIKNLHTLTGLTRLSLQANRITTIVNLDALTQLQELFLSENGITQLREEGADQQQGCFHTMVNLKILDLSANQLIKLEDLSSNLQSIEELWLNDNKIDNYRQLEHLQCYKTLYSIYLQGNPIYSDGQYKRKMLFMLPQLQQIDGFNIDKSKLLMQ